MALVTSHTPNLAMWDGQSDEYKNMARCHDQIQQLVQTSLPQQNKAKQIVTAGVVVQTFGALLSVLPTPGDAVGKTIAGVGHAMQVAGKNAVTADRMIEVAADYIMLTYNLTSSAANYRTIERCPVDMLGQLQRIGASMVNTLSRLSKGNNFMRLIKGQKSKAEVDELARKIERLRVLVSAQLLGNTHDLVSRGQAQPSAVVAKAVQEAVKDEQVLLQELTITEEVEGTPDEEEAAALKWWIEDFAPSLVDHNVMARKYDEGEWQKLYIIAYHQHTTDGVLHKVRTEGETRERWIDLAGYEVETGFGSGGSDDDGLADEDDEWSDDEDGRAYDEDNRIRPLVEQLRPSNGMRTRKEACGGLDALCCGADDRSKVAEDIRRAGGVKALVRILEPGNRPALQAKAAEALYEIVRTDSEAIKNAVAKAGGIPLVVNQLGDLADPAAHEWAAHLIWIIGDGDYQAASSAIAAGAAPALVSLLKPWRRTQPQSYAAGAIAGISRGGGRPANEAIVAAGGREALRELIKKSADRDVRMYAKIALEAINCGV